MGVFARPLASVHASEPQKSGNDACTPTGNIALCPIRTHERKAHPARKHHGHTCAGSASQPSSAAGVSFPQQSNVRRHV